MHSQDLITLRDNDGRINITTVWPKNKENFNVSHRVSGFFVTDDNRSIFWKRSEPYTFTDFGDVIASHLARQFGLRSTKYFFARNGKYQGVICLDYRREGETEILGQEFLTDIYKQMHKTDKSPDAESLNNLSFFKKALSFCVKENIMSKTDATALMSNMIKMLFLDLAISNPDRHTRNWGLLRKENNYRMIPIIDSARGFNFYLTKQELYEQYKEYVKNPNKQNQKKIERFYNKQSKENTMAFDVLPESACYNELNNKYKPLSTMQILMEVKKEFPKQFEELLFRFYTLSFPKAYEAIEKETGVAIPSLVKDIAFSSYEARYNAVRKQFGQIAENKTSNTASIEF